MNSMGVRAALAFLLLFIATVKAAEGGVTFSQKNFKMICPEEGTWFKELKKESHVGQSYELEYSGTTKGFYHCKYKVKEDDKEDDEKETTYYFYVKGKVCENCFELDAAVFGCTIVADVVGTACVMLIIYRCTKKRRSAGLTQAPRAPARPGGRPPPVSPDYEQLRPGTRSADPYSTVNRMG